jgi:hypothetical protein
MKNKFNLKKDVLYLTLILLSTFNLIYSQIQKTPVVIYTPRGEQVPDSWNFREIGSPTLDSLDAYYTLLRPNAIKIGRSSQTYNCHGYAWYLTAGGSSVWIGILNTQSQYIFWTGGSYNQVDPSVATIISYTESDNHSAIKIDASG